MLSSMSLVIMLAIDFPGENRSFMMNKTTREIRTDTFLDIFEILHKSFKKDVCCYFSRRFIQNGKGLYYSKMREGCMYI